MRRRKPWRWFGLFMFSIPSLQFTTNPMNRFLLRFLVSVNALT
jgi:hypothetical protein